MTQFNSHQDKLSRTALLSIELLTSYLHTNKRSRQNLLRSLLLFFYSQLYSFFITSANSSSV